MTNMCDVSSLPVLLVVDADEEALGRTVGELRRRYERDYRVVAAPSPAEGVDRLDELRGAEEELALVLADQACTDLLEHIRKLYPRAKRGLLISWGEWADEGVAQAVRESMALGRIDYYVLKPWTTPDEYLHRLLSELLLEWRRSDPGSRREVTVVADPAAPRTHEIRNLLARSGVPHVVLATGSPEGKSVLAENGRARAAHPVVCAIDGTVLDDPTDTELAQHGFRVPTELEKFDFDVVVAGAGPAGLAAAVYATSEGLETLVVEPASIGGQAGSSSRIRNYLGFPRGLSGAELAQRAYQQAWVFGTHFVLTRGVTRLTPVGNRYALQVSNGGQAMDVTASSVVLAMGIDYRRLDVPALDRFLNAGVFYGSSPADAQAFSGQRVVIVGAGNSAGQAAAHLSRYAEQVLIVCRGSELSRTMSQYLRHEIGARENIDVRLETQVVDADGEERLERVALRSPGGVTWEPASAVVVLIGARPHTEWLEGQLARGEADFLLTDDALGSDWPLGRQPFRYETSLPGVFAIGDVRSGSVKRVSAAVGEGAAVVQQIHRYLEALEHELAVVAER
jgi:thioredoxin reductase (NADPH)